MPAGRMQDFFGDDFDEAIDSLKSAPGAFGNILIAAIRQLHPLDVAAFALVIGGWAVFIYGAIAGHGTGMQLLSLLPTGLWLAAGIAGGVIFHVGGIGYRSLGYWESYVLIVTFSFFGVL